MSTDKACYRPGELVNITATGWAGVPSIGDFPRIFWAITNTSLDAVFETSNMLTAVGGFNGTLNGTWNQTYRLLGGQPPSGSPVPFGRYTIWFYEIPRPNEPPPDWAVPAEIFIGDCSGSLVVDPGGPYRGREGEALRFNATSSAPEESPVEFRWDVDGNGIWDSDWSSSGDFRYTFGDNHEGQACVEARTLLPSSPLYQVTDPSVGWGVLQRGIFHAQSFVATQPVATRFRFSLAINSPTPESPILISLNRSLDGESLVTWEVDAEGLPVRQVHWVEIPRQNVSLEVGARYFVVFSTQARGGVYEVHISSDQYPDGAYFSKSGLAGWNETSQLDVMMEIWGPSERYASACSSVRVENVPPAIVLESPDSSTSTEGASVTLSARASDPGSDDLTITWRWDHGPTETRTHYNDGTGPDPPDSYGGRFPFNASDNSTHTHGDDGLYWVSLTVEDDDGGNASAELAITVANIAPSVSLAVIPSGDEGDTITFQARATDPGSDDLSFSWWGHCDGWSAASILYPNDPTNVPDPDPSPEVHPRNVTDTQTVVCGDDGEYEWNVRVEDDDGGVTTLSGMFRVDNLPPSLTVSPPSFVWVKEGAAVSLDATATDPGSDDLSFTWRWDHGPVEMRVFYNDGAAPDPPNSTDGTFPFTASDRSIHTYGDDCRCTITLTVEDDDGGAVTYTTTIEAVNVAPTSVGDVSVTLTANVTLRVAGEKWHDVSLTLYDAGTEVANVSVTRYPGSPDDQAATVPGVTFDLLGGSSLSAVVEYTPLDDPVNGQVWGANPVWIILTARDGTEVRIHHTFNLRHEDTWTWTIDAFGPYLVGLPIDFAATATDPGSDDLTFTWSWGDGTANTVTTYFNDGLGPDTFPSPEVNPITMTDIAAHAFRAAGTYAITLTVTDDDGGVVEIYILVSLA